MGCPTLRDLPNPPDAKTGWPWTEGSPGLPAVMPGGRPWPAVSIVTPSFNQAEFVEETIRSVLLQGYPNLEYIVMDGRSTDGSADIIRRYEPWLTSWVSEPDRGQSDAINRGWRRSHGEIITWINSDDTYCPTALYSAVSFLVEHGDVDLIYGNCNCVGPDGQFLGVLKAWPFDLRRQMTGRNLVLQSSSFFRRSALHKSGELNADLHYLMDYDLWTRMLQDGFVVRDVPFTLSNYRLHSSAKTVAHRVKMVSEMKAILDRLYSTPSPHYPAGWSRHAYSTYHRAMGEAHLRAGDRAKARREFLRAIASEPLRPTVIVVMAYWLDTWFGTRLGPFAQRMRWRLPDVPDGDVLLGEGATRQWW